MKPRSACTSQSSWPYILVCLLHPSENNPLSRSLELGRIYKAMAQWEVLNRPEKVVEATEHCADEDGSFGSDTKQGISGTIAASWLLLLVCTPVPLITLRFFCKVVMGMPTPGEFLCGYASVSDGSFWVRSLQNTGIALGQYVIVCVSLSGAPLCAILAAFPPLWLLMLSQCAPWFAEVRWVFILGCPVLTAYLIVYFPSLLLRPKSAEHPESLIDRLCRMKVVRQNRFSQICQSRKSY